MTPFLFLALFLADPAFADRTMRGIRNEKCAATEEEAKLAVGERLASDAKLCEESLAPVQSGGWTCKSGDCKKGTLRCNTQYVCEPKTIDQSSRFAPSGTPAPDASPSVVPKMTGVPTIAASPTPSAPDSRRELKDGESTYIEETKPTSDGKSLTSVRKKAVGQKSPQTSLRPSPTITAVPAGAPSPTSTPSPITTPSSAERAVEGAVASALASGAKYAAAMAPVLKAIGACQPYQATVSVKDGPSVRMEVHGMVGGKCKFTQAESDTSSQLCLFTDKERADIAKGGLTAFRTTMVDPEVCP